MGMKAGGDGDELNSEINVTPMVDVMLVLLVIFMVAAPMMNTGVDVDLPKVNAQKIQDPKGKLILTIEPDAQGKATLSLSSPGTENPTLIKWTELKAKLAGNERLKVEKVLWVEGNAGLKYSVIVTAMAIAKEAGVEKVQLLTDPQATIPVHKLDQAPP